MPLDQVRGLIQLTGGKRVPYRIVGQPVFGVPGGGRAVQRRDTVRLLGATLCEALERLAAARGTRNLSVDASDNALDFFRKRGYVAKQRNSVTVNGEWLANTTMQKTLGGGEA